MILELQNLLLLDHKIYCKCKTENKNIGSLQVKSIKSIEAHRPIATDVNKCTAI